MLDRDVSSVLGLEESSRTYAKLKALVRECVPKIFNLDVIYTEQGPTRLAEFRGQISRNFPDIFEHSTLDRDTREERMKAIMIYSRKHFYNARHEKRAARAQEHAQAQAARAAITRKKGGRRKRRTCSPSSSPPGEDPIVVALNTAFNQDAHEPTSHNPDVPQSAPQSHSVSSDSETTVYVRQPRLMPPATSNNDERSIVLPLPLPPVSHAPPMLSISSASFPFAGTFSTIPRSKTTPPSPQSSALTLTADSPTALIGTNGLTTAKNTFPSLAEYCVDEVAAFLRSCTPNMQFLLNSFIAFGLRNNELLGMVAKWPNEKIDEFLKKVVGVTPEILAVLPEMEFYLLREHFKGYFPE